MNQRLSPPDGIMLFCVLVLAATSLIMVGSASLGISEVRYGDALHILRRWLIYMPVGLALMWAVSRIEVDWWRTITLPLLGAALLIMVLVLIPGVGQKLNGAKRWFSIFGVSLQPVELLKPAIVIYMAHYMAAFPDRLREFRTGLLPMLVVLGASLFLLLLQPDFGSSALLAGVCMGMWLIGGVPVRHLLLLLLPAVPLGAFVLVSESYRMKRLMSFIDPWADPLGSGYQLVQSMIAFGAGGIHGSGIGQGVQKLFYLPEPYTDFIIAVVGEELGLIGVVSLTAVFMLLLWRGLRLAYSAENSFQRLLVMGCVLLLGLTFTINMGAASGLLPTKGMPMPIISYGGSALFGACILIGMLFSVQRHRPDNRIRKVVA